MCVSGESPNHTRHAVVREKLIPEIYMIKYVSDKIKCMSMYSKLRESCKRIRNDMFLPCFSDDRTWCCDVYSYVQYTL